MRYARLKKDWLLRGWTDKPRTIINWINGDCRRLSEQSFFVAQACDGMTDFHSVDVLPQHNELLDKFIQQGMAEECDRGDVPELCQQYRKADNPYIRSIHWSITGRCNLKCRHCYMESPAGRYGELPLPEIIRLIDQFAQANVHQVDLSGGEPFLRDDLLEIMAALADKKIGVAQIYSNGLLITDEILQGIKDLGLLPNIQVSFDGCGIHELIRGVRGIEQAVIQAVRRLRAHGFQVTVATSLDRSNVGVLKETYALMKELDIKFWRVAPPQKIGNFRHTTTALSLEEMMAACAPIAARWSADGKPFSLQLPGFSGPQLNSGHENNGYDRYTPESYDCAFVRLATSVLPDGTVIPCPGFADTAVYEQMPNLLVAPFTKIWSQSSLRSIIDRKKSDVLAAVGECAACDQFKVCGAGCRAAAMVENGQLMSKDPRSCEYYKNNYLQRFQELTLSSMNESEEN